MLRCLRRDETGGVFVETAVLIPILFVFLLGAVDFLYAFSQWTAATKAAQVGARLAAVSDSVAVGLTGTGDNISTLAVSETVHLGDAMPDFEVTCNDGGSGACLCTRGTCPGVSGYSSAAMNRLVYGRGSSSCSDATSNYNAGMCDIFDRILPANVRIVYSQTGLGYAGRSWGPVPTITVTLQNLNYEYVFLGGLKGFTSRSMPSFTTTMTGEAMSSAAAQ